MTFPRLIIYLAKNEQLVQHIKVQLLKSRRLSSHIKQSSQRLRYVVEIYLQNICGMSSIGIKFTYFEIRFEMHRNFFQNCKMTQQPCCKRSLHQANLDSPSPRPIIAFGKKR